MHCVGRMRNLLILNPVVNRIRTVLQNVNPQQSEIIIRHQQSRKTLSAVYGVRCASVLKTTRAGSIVLRTI